MRKAVAISRWVGLGSGDGVLASIMLSDFFGALAGALVHLTMVWWVLEQGVSGPVVSMLVLCIFLPLNIGVLLTGVAVARFGARRLLIVSKLIATCGAIACFAFLASGTMTLLILAMIAIVTYGAMAPSVAADISRAPAIAKLAKRRLETFHASNGIAMVIGQMLGLSGAGWLWEISGPETAVGLGVVMVLISTAVTWIGFPRDHLNRGQTGAMGLAQVRTLSRAVMQNLTGGKIDLALVLVTAGIIAISQGCIEVAFPIALSAADLPASALSQALVLATITGIAGMLVAQRTYLRIALSKALLIIASLLFVVLSLCVPAPGMVGFTVAVGATSMAASAAATYTVTALQERMPASLQAQAIGLWQCLILSVGSVAILVTGFAVSWALTLMAVAAGCCVLGILRRRWGAGPHSPTAQP